MWVILCPHYKFAKATCLWTTDIKSILSHADHLSQIFFWEKLNKQLYLLNINK